MGREVGERNSRGGKSATKEVRYGYKLLSRSGEHICMSAQYRHTSVTLGMSVTLSVDAQHPLRLLSQGKGRRGRLCPPLMKLKRKTAYVLRYRPVGYYGCFVDFTHYRTLATSHKHNAQRQALKRTGTYRAAHDRGAGRVSERSRTRE